MLSMLRFFGTLQGLWVSIAIGASLHFFGISKGFIFYGIGMGAVLLLLMFLYLALEKRKM